MYKLPFMQKLAIFNNKKIDAYGAFCYCTICYSEDELCQLYCGHIMCQNCLINEIKYQLENGVAPV